MNEERKQCIRGAVADTFAEEYVRELIEALEEAESAGYPAQLAEIRAAVEVCCDPPPNGGHVQAIRRLAAERDRLREKSQKDATAIWELVEQAQKDATAIWELAERVAKAKWPQQDAEDLAKSTIQVMDETAPDFDYISRECWEVGDDR